MPGAEAHRRREGMGRAGGDGRRPPGHGGGVRNRPAGPQQRGPGAEFWPLPSRSATVPTRWTHSPSTGSAAAVEMTIGIRRSGPGRRCPSWQGAPSHMSYPGPVGDGALALCQPASPPARQPGHCGLAGTRPAGCSRSRSGPRCAGSGADGGAPGAPCPQCRSCLGGDRRAHQSRRPRGARAHWWRHGRRAQGPDQACDL